MSLRPFTGPFLIALTVCDTSRIQAENLHTYVQGSLHHSSTELEGALRGYGEAMRGLGAGLRDTAEAQCLNQEASKRSIENQQRLLYCRQEAQQLYQSKQQAKWENRATAEQLARWAKEAAPQPLLRNQLSDDGTIRWPIALCDERHNRDRELIEAATIGLASETDPRRIVQLRQRVFAGCENIKDGLRDRRAEVLPNEYVAGAKFLNSLRHEVQQSFSSPTIDKVARR